MKTSEIRVLSLNELSNKAQELKENLFRLKFKLATGDLEDSSQIKKTKKDIARIKTVLKEKQAEG
mgnify:CR=1 FL=1